MLSCAADVLGVKLAIDSKQLSVVSQGVCRLEKGLSGVI